MASKSMCSCCDTSGGHLNSETSQTCFPRLSNVAPKKKTPKWLNNRISTCIECLRASCWQGVNVCEGRKRGNPQKITTNIGTLIAMKSEENPVFWLTDEELADA